jgi:hypothetical protein
MKIDIEHLQFIDASEVPGRPSSQYSAIFDKIPEGQALVLENDKTLYTNFRAAVHRGKGKYSNIFIARRNGKLYIIKEKILANERMEK